jgi:hypothetical protein
MQNGPCHVPSILSAIDNCRTIAMPFTAEFFRVSNPRSTFLSNAPSISQTECLLGGCEASQGVLLVAVVLRQVWSNGVMAVTGGKRSTQRKTCPSAPVCTANLTRTDLGWNLVLWGDRPVTTRLSQGTANC